MKTFTLIAFLWLGGTDFPRIKEVRTPDLPELQCKLMACR
jgi:hypothetical protein